MVQWSLVESLDFYEISERLFYQNDFTLIGTVDNGERRRTYYLRFHPSVEDGMDLT